MIVSSSDERIIIINSFLKKGRKTLVLAPTTTRSNINYKRYINSLKTFSFIKTKRNINLIIFPNGSQIEFKSIKNNKLEGEHQWGREVVSR